MSTTNAVTRATLGRAEEEEEGFFNADTANGEEDSKRDHTTLV